MFLDSVLRDTLDYHHNLSRLARIGGDGLPMSEIQLTYKVGWLEYRDGLVKIPIKINSAFSWVFERPYDYVAVSYVTDFCFMDKERLLNGVKEWFKDKIKEDSPRDGVMVQRGDNLYGYVGLEKFLNFNKQ